MNRCLLGMLLSAGLALRAAQAPRAPVLVELFTSEGCSSCPPADRLLEQLDARAVVLSEHVDYWDHDGWKDPFSSPALTQRQQSYARRFALPSPYTPEMVVDGGAEFTGGDGPRALRAIADAALRPKAEIRISRGADGVIVDVAAAPHTGNVFLALADDRGASRVAAGENRGRSLHHVAILRRIEKIGSVKRGAGFRRSLRLPAGVDAQRVVVFLQEPDLGRIWGAAVLPPSAS